MAVLRHYQMTARDGQADALKQALEALALRVRTLEGCSGVDIHQDLDDAHICIFIERWESREAHQSSGKAVPKEVFAPVMACLSAPPAGRYLAAD